MYFFILKPAAPIALFAVWKSKFLMPVAINIDANIPNTEVHFNIYVSKQLPTITHTF